jgi:hypothetical protein
MKLTQALVTGFTAILISLGVHIEAHAESPLNPIDHTTHLTGTIARNPLSLDAEEDDTQEDPETEASGDRKKSMMLIERGYAAEQKGNTDLALRKYYAAMQADRSNGYAFLMAGHLLIPRKIGFDCLKIALARFKAEQDREGYELAHGLLQESNAAN